ncbi:TetR/AcrR family transcriptional regulator [Actinoplanes sp. NBRC 103695]|uniref:TetR/AcrR family transcriptional regulator n=1 Tax=Actinoplanes sp. NBRC 103695 TaxID=3032202 RepID=UPI002553ECB5|nr:TetR/AcrR family transcriptional regulator [Actinoplanes sp. NBRC 103695]
MDDKRRLILDQALALVDERGLAAMSMRAVAERVGLTSMALYPYVGGKDALLDGLVDLLHLELGAACADPGHLDWRQRLRALGRAVRALAHTHPGAFPLLLNRSAAGASASWLAAALRGVLHDAGAGAADEPRLARMICAFLLGYATGEITGGLPGSSPLDLSARAGPTSADCSGPLAAVTSGAPRRSEPPAPTAGETAGREGAGAAEFDADLEDLVRLVEVAVRGR